MARPSSHRTLSRQLHPLQLALVLVTGNGDLNNQGTHQLDVARWAIDTDQTHPVRARAIGGRFQWGDQGETPNTLFGIAEYPNGQQVMFNVRNVNYKGYQRQVENEYYFEDGGKIVRGKYYAKGNPNGESISVPSGKVTEGGNWGSFVAACRAGKPEMASKMYMMPIMVAFSDTS